MKVGEDRKRKIVYWWTIIMVLLSIALATWIAYLFGRSLTGRVT